MAVSEKDRDYMRRLGEFKAESHRLRREAHLKLSIAERLERSLAIAAEMRPRVDLSRREDDPGVFYALARARGLYRP